MRTVEKKATAESARFWAMRAEFAAAPPAGQKYGKAAKAMETDLFGSVGSSGIRFADYEAVEVERSGPGARDPPPLDAFSDAQQAVPSALSDNLGRCRYATPTPIQRHAVPLGLAGHDLMCVAQTGSGKTCGFLLPVMARLLKDGSGSVRFGPNQPASPSAVVMAPTRELAVQIHEEARRLSFLTRLRSCVVYGGAAAGGQLRDLAAGVDICVATPGRLQDFVDRGVISLAGSRVLVLDEADRMLDMGFEPQIRKLIDKRDMPTRAQGRQTLMFSATFAPEVQRLARDFLREYTYVTVGRVGSTVSAITQNLVWCAQNDKRAKLGLLRVALEDAPPPARTLVFCTKKRTAAWVAREMCRDGVPAESIHGDRSQSQRESALAAFKAGRSPVLVATDVAARGIDVSGVAHVVNFDLPNSPDDFDSYVHRIGRTGRAGHEGRATSFFVPGNDPKQGNGRIAGPLLQLLREAGQEVPQWLPGQAPGAGSGQRNVAARDARHNASRGQSVRYTAATSGQAPQPQLLQPQQQQPQQQQPQQQQPAAKGDASGKRQRARSAKKQKENASGGAAAVTEKGPKPPSKKQKGPAAPPAAASAQASGGGDGGPSAAVQGAKGRSRRGRGRGRGRGGAAGGGGGGGQ